MTGDSLQSAPRRRTVVRYRVARCQAEREAAFRLLHNSYVHAGLMKPAEHGLRVTPYHLLPTTEVFVAEVRGTVVTTVSLVGDGELGMPMESTYPEEVARRRDAGLALAEVSCLADRRLRTRHGFLEHLCELARVMAQYARKQCVDQLLVIAHPRHARFYERFMGFEKIGDLAPCAYVENNPAVALCLDFRYIDSHPPSCYDFFFGQPIAEADLQPSPMDCAERRYFQQFVTGDSDHPSIGNQPSVDDASKKQAAFS